MKKPLIILAICFILLVALSTVGRAQTQTHAASLPCGNDLIDGPLLAAHPEMVIKMDSLEAFTQRYVASHQPGNISSRSSSDSLEYIIPVVFHIIHNYGPEDISDSQVIDEVNTLNKDYNLLNPDTVVVIPQFKSIEANCHMTFRLAQIDPNGNCTTGIEHIHDLLTYDGGDEVKPLYDWPRNEYLNIWVVAAIKIGDNDVAGYAYFPSEVDGVFSAPYDGVIILSNYVGSVGTSSAYTGRAVTHEIGHTMNLEHPWGLTNSPGVACGDDNVFDTPITEGSFPVGTCDSALDYCNPPIIENVQNYMDYSYCSKMFTNGQKLRMWAALNANQSDRTNLWSSANLAAAGVDGNTVAACAPVADFNVNENFICQDASYTFTDVSWGGAETSREWIFTNGTPATSNAATPKVTFNTPGWQTVTLIAKNANGSDTLIQNNSIYVSSSTADFTPPFYEQFNDTARFNNQWFVVNPEANTSTTTYNQDTWALWTDAGDNSSTSAGLTDFGDFAGDYKDLISPSFNISATGNYQLSFDYSAATTSTSNTNLTDTFTVEASSNCGATWFPLKSITGTQLANAGLWAVNYVPQPFSTYWTPVTLNIPGFLNTKNTRFKFEVISGGYGNNVFIDDVYLGLANTSGIPQLNADNLALNVFPDPAGENATVTYHLSADANVIVDVLDISGRLMKEPVNAAQVAGDHTLALNNNTVGNLADGIYIIRLWVDGTSVIKKLVIAKN